MLRLQSFGCCCHCITSRSKWYRNGCPDAVTLSLIYGRSVSLRAEWSIPFTQAQPRTLRLRSTGSQSMRLHPMSHRSSFAQIVCHSSACAHHDASQMRRVARCSTCIKSHAAFAKLRSCASQGLTRHDADSARNRPRQRRSGGTCNPPALLLGPELCCARAYSAQSPLIFVRI
jgi:hypothetical protein